MEKLNIILASVSPRRASLLKEIPFLDFKIIPPKADELCDFSLPMQEIVMELAFKKAQSVVVGNSGIVLGADTLVFLDNTALGKPEDIAKARTMLTSLCGKTHRVLTGVCIIDSYTNKVLKGFEETLVTFKNANENIIDNYIKTGKSLDKAGAYGIQDEELLPLIESIKGDLNNVIGLPTSLVRRLLNDLR